ncbi:MAG: aminodeoxychorismate/anthranilate synthase component II [Phycisphaerae bacterium]|nr:aminodeoxychorismate/anthranilate synthase component II [Phycisphaerae bacterium]
MKNVLFIDNFDSFTYNLVDDFAKRDCRTTVYRADMALEELLGVVDRLRPDWLVISPGPGNPRSAGVSMAAVDRLKGKVPIFGVCLGLQVIVECLGGTVGRAPQPMHGKPSPVLHDAKGVFAGIETPMQAGRYHSLVATRVPDCLRVTAECDGLVMAVEHREYPMFAVQFHPESILTPAGGRIIENILAMDAMALPAEPA